MDGYIKCLTHSISNFSGNTLSSFTSMSENNFSQKSTSSAESSIYEPSYRINKDINISSNHNQNMIELKEIALTSQRYNISSRATADFGLITKNELPIIADKNKIVRQKRKIQTVSKKIAEEETEFQSIYFDGRKDNTLIQVKKDSKYFRQTVKEEHISLISEPESSYVGHVTSISGQSNDIADKIYELLLKQHPESIGNINVIGCDGTAVNNGWKGRIIRRIEEKFDHPLQT